MWSFQTVRGCLRSYWNDGRSNIPTWMRAIVGGSSFGLSIVIVGVATFVGGIV